MKNYFIHIYGSNIRRFLFVGVNGASYVRRSSDIWVTGCNYVESVIFVRKCSNISLWGCVRPCSYIYYILLNLSYFCVLFRQAAFAVVTAAISELSASHN